MPQQPPPQSPQPIPPPNTEPGRTGGQTPPQGGPRPVGRPTPPGGVPSRRPQGFVPTQGYGPGQGSGPGGYVPRPAPGPAVGYGPPPTRPGSPTRAFTGPTRATGATAVAAKEEPKRDLTVNKLLAGAGAASTSAVLGSFFGEMGTVTGAAVGSLVSAVATSVYQHSLDKTRDTVKAKIKLPGGRTVDVAGKTEVPAPPVAPGGETGQARVYVTPADHPTEVMSAVPATGAVAAGPPRSRRRLLVMTGFTVLVFVLGMLAVTGIELVKGSPLNTSSSTTDRSGGTSLGGVLGGDTGGASTETTEETATESATDSAEPTAEETTSARSTAQDEGSASTTAEQGGVGVDESQSTTSGGARVTPTPSPTPQSGSGGGADANAQGGGGAADTAPR